MHNSQQVEVSVFQKAKRGNYYCGDSYFYEEQGGTFICALADGLGSGEYAKESSQIVVDTIKENSDIPIKTLLHKCNQKLIGKRGVVLGILQIDLMKMKYYYSSIGNIGLMTITPNSIRKRNIPQPGYLSGYDRPFKVLTGTVEQDMIFMMFSDGITAKEVSNPHFLHREVQHITDTFSYLYQQKLDDDATLIAMKYTKETS
ncbi:negative regulator of sigma-B (phosphoserine phosphatase) [Gracilibacillus ureilyticus]|uniref:Negative regulator of sigma-B (Phosphoserine phosphatase) n=1 Tax=Gracilibacillus ureilyticus TaxID=531814 RepID=A0A1H9NRV7_9BACI|nr:SpoIIE family protein phosphatase [Gracilibacillus ureilyticus]SER38369.1 negative regulator of sigma-B (phosphoserine phosphatase) [Gracilibacillus ureilyticus]